MAVYHGRKILCRRQGNKDYFDFLVPKLETTNELRVNPLPPPVSCYSARDHPRVPESTVHSNPFLKIARNKTSLEPQGRTIQGVCGGDLERTLWQLWLHQEG